MVVLTNEGINAHLAFTIALLMCLAIGYMNAIITIKFGIPSFIATLGTMFMVRSVAIVIVKATSQHFQWKRCIT